MAQRWAIPPKIGNKKKVTRLSQENVKGKYYLGRKVVDSYGGSIGKVVGYYSKTKNSSLIVGLELTNGVFKEVQSSQLIDEANVFVLDENWKTKADELTQNLILNNRKISALDKLYSSGEISSEACENLRKDFDEAIYDIKEQRTGFLESLNVRSKTLDCKLKEIENYFVNVKVAHELGEMDDEAYRISRDMLHDLINRLQAEQRDVIAAGETLELTQKQSDVSQNSKKQDIEKPSDGISRVPSDSPLLLKIEEAEK